MKRRAIKINALAQAQLIKYLLEGTYNCRELAELTGLHFKTVSQYTRALHRAGACHIHMWEKDCREQDRIKIYKLGEGRDAKPRKLTAAERQARVRAKKRALAFNQMLIGGGDVEAA